MDKKPFVIPTWPEFHAYMRFRGCRNNVLATLGSEIVTFDNQSKRTYVYLEPIWNMRRHVKIPNPIVANSLVPKFGFALETSESFHRKYRTATVVCTNNGNRFRSFPAAIRPFPYAVQGIFRVADDGLSTITANRNGIVRIQKWNIKHFEKRGCARLYWDDVFEGSLYDLSQGDERWIDAATAAIEKVRSWDQTKVFFAREELES